MAWLRTTGTALADPAPAGYRVVTTRPTAHGRQITAVWPPTNEPAADRAVALRRFSALMLFFRADLAVVATGTMAAELLPDGGARIQVMADDNARDLIKAVDLAWLSAAAGSWL